MFKLTPNRTLERVHRLSIVVLFGLLLSACVEHDARERVRVTSIESTV